MVNSSVISIPVGGLAAGNLYQVHVESISQSGIANSSPMSFETGPASGHHQTVPTVVIVILSLVVLLAVIVLVHYR